MIFGYELKNGELVVNDKEAEMIRKIFENYTSGCSMRKSGLLEEKTFTHSSVKNIIRQKKYAGNDGYPVIVDAELFEKANSMLKFNIENDWKYGIKKERKNIIHKIFYLKEATTVYADPFKNAEYLYSLIEVIK